MKKQTILKVIVVTLVMLLLSAGLVLAETERIYFEGTRCRSSFDAVSEEVGGRLKQTINEALWPITTDNELIDGVWVNYDTKSNREILAYPPPFYFLGTGFIAGKLMIIPDAVDGYWEGNVTMVFTGGGDSFTQAELKGKGDLEGLKLVIDIENADVSQNGILCFLGGWIEFYGYILNPGGKWEPPE
jgi:hypothetical protein